VAHRDVEVASGHDVRVDADAERLAGEVVADVLQGLDVVDVDLDAQLHGLLDFLHGDRVGRVNDVVGLESGL